jgi:uncharacterized protein YndB with AHSA1/START domain
MSTDLETRQPFQAFEIKKEIDIAAPPEIAFESMLEELGPEGQMLDGTSMSFKLEAWPGGRWYRDLGKKGGHLWGQVQVIKPPTLLEITGPMMMSYPAINHLQYRFTPQGSGTRLTFLHRAMGLILTEHREGVGQGWSHWISRMRERAEQKAKRKS